MRITKYGVKLVKETSCNYLDNEKNIESRKTMRYGKRIV